MSVAIQVWDLPLRLFHWSLVLAVLAEIVTGELGGSLIDWHGRIGIFILGLLVFRVVWGFIGSTNARFGHFFPTPAKISAYLKGQWQGQGHNPLGAISVFALLGVLAVLVGTGLFANDDIAYYAPLFNFVDKSVSDKLTALHEWAFNILAGLLVLHIAAIIFYATVKKHNLVIPMLTGKAVVPDAQASDVRPAGILRLVIALVIAGAVVGGIGFGVSYLDPVKSAPPPAAPNW
jgi:cytochrome b